MMIALCIGHHSRHLIQTIRTSSSEFSGLSCDSIFRRPRRGLEMLHLLPADPGVIHVTQASEGARSCTFPPCFPSLSVLFWSQPLFLTFGASESALAFLPGAYKAITSKGKLLIWQLGCNVLPGDSLDFQSRAIICLNRQVPHHFKINITIIRMISSFRIL